MNTFCEDGRAVLRAESEALAALTIGEEFAQACRLILAARGHVVVSGLGKSGHIGAKIAATLASTGTPAFFLHASEAGHGDLGMVTTHDVLLAISYSGSCGELLALAPRLRALQVPLIALTGRADSPLAKLSTVALTVAISGEACPLGLAPTTSTTATLALGDALAVALLKARDFSREDFALSHPFGRLGRQLTLRVGDVMRTGEALPCLPPTATVAEALLTITRCGMGMSLVRTGSKLLGIYTDGDLRRSLERYPDALQRQISGLMTAVPQTTTPETRAAEALQQMQRQKINALPVLEAGALVGAVQLHDLLRALG